MRAAQNGAPNDIITQITKSTNMEDALVLASDYVRGPKQYTGDVGEYQFYVEQETAAGRTPMTFAEWQMRAKGSSSSQDIIEYEYAKQGGYTGSFADWMRKKTAGRSGGGSGGGGASSSEMRITRTPDDLDTFWKNYQKVYQVSISKDAPKVKKAYQEYLSQFNSAPSVNDEYMKYAQKYVDGEINLSQLEAKFGKAGKNQILAMSADLTKTKQNTDYSSIIAKSMAEALANR